jgi:TonB family protein
VVAERDGRVVPSSSATAGPAPGRGRGPVFDSSDPLVTPAVLVRPRLPDNPPPGVPEEQIGTLEIVVSESGAVDHVRLISPANRYQERMIVAAAKAWHFQPATRHGRPVRYRTRIRVTL